MKKDKSFDPFIKDFAFYKARFGMKHKEIKALLREFASLVERFEASATES
jgi:hypothetical protein